jgi:hypothetical protein
MASTITAGNATNGLALSCDNTGILELKTGTGSGTTALTIDASQNVTLATGIAGDFKMNSGYGSVATAYGCRAWVNFDGTGTPAIRASGNVSSITDNGTGNYTVNISVNMPDADYATPTSCANVLSGAAGSQNGDIYVNDLVAGSYRILTANNGTFTDMPIVTSSVIR